MARRKTKSTALATMDRPMFYGSPDPITLHKMENLVTNLGRSLSNDPRRRAGDYDPRRNIPEECGWPDFLDTYQYKKLIDRDPLAGIVNMIYPIETWKVQFEVWESDDEDVDTGFEDDYADIPRQLAAGVEPSHHKDKKGNLLNEFFLHFDIIMGYGRFGVAVLGMNDGKKLSEPVEPSPDNELYWLRALPEHQVQIMEFENGDPSSPRDERNRRIGLPTIYNVTFNDPFDQTSNGVQESYTTEQVHWSRIVHCFDRWHHPSTSRNFGCPSRVWPVLDPVLDARKVRGGSSEMYWGGALPGYHFGTHPQLGPDVDVDRGEVQDMYEDLLNGLQRIIATSGMTVDSLAPTVVDPTPQIQVQLDVISMKTRVPKRILMGSERGEQSSIDDRKNFNANLSNRQSNHNTPRVLVPFIDRLINLGVCRPPAEDTGYSIAWADMTAENGAEQATILLTKTQAYTSYVQGMNQLVPPKSYMTTYDNIPNETADAMLEEAEQAAADEEAEMQQMADEHGLVPDPTDTGFRDPPPPNPDEVATSGKTNLVQNESSRVLINCHGKGGKPGPCPDPNAKYKKDKGKGKGGGQPKQPVKGPPKLSEKAQRAKDAHKLVDKTIQRYAEEHNEPKIAKKLGGASLKDNEPIDVKVGSHGVELKTMVSNKNSKITMKRSAMELKASWEKKNKADIHTLVVDDQKVFNAKGDGKHDESKREFYYRRGYGSFRVGTMYKASSIEEVRKLMDAKDKDLPEAARRPKGQSRGKLS